MGRSYPIPTLDQLAFTGHSKRNIAVKEIAMWFTENFVLSEYYYKYTEESLRKAIMKNAKNKKNVIDAIKLINKIDSYIFLESDFEINKAVNIAITYLKLCKKTYTYIECERYWILPFIKGTKETAKRLGYKEMKLNGHISLVKFGS